MIKLEILEPDKLTISLDIITVCDFVTMDEDINVSENEETIISDIVKIIKSFGYYVTTSYKSNGSNSLYFTFCKETEFDTQQVTLIIRLRVSDHELPLWKSDKSVQDAKNRQLNNLKQYAHNNKWLNTTLSDSEEIPVEYIYIKYENEFYVTEEDVYKKVQQKIAQFDTQHE